MSSIGVSTITATPIPKARPRPNLIITLLPGLKRPKTSRFRYGRCSTAGYCSSSAAAGGHDGTECRRSNVSHSSSVAALGGGLPLDETFRFRALCTRRLCGCGHARRLFGCLARFLALHARRQRIACAQRNGRRQDHAHCLHRSREPQLQQLVLWLSGCLYRHGRHELQGPKDQIAAVEARRRSTISITP